MATFGEVYEEITQTIQRIGCASVHPLWKYRYSISSVWSDSADNGAVSKV